MMYFVCFLCSGACLCWCFKILCLYATLYSGTLLFFFFFLSLYVFSGVILSSHFHLPRKYQEKTVFTNNVDHCLSPEYMTYMITNSCV